MKLSYLKNYPKNVHKTENSFGGAGNRFCLVVNSDVLLNWYFS